MEIKLDSYKILSKINSPQDLKTLNIDDLLFLSEELRDYILTIVSTEGGHLGANLGVIELTIALHFVFNAPEDNIVWDVGHQAYSHKILTGRKDLFPTNRKKNGLAGFPSRKESIYDVFGVGHSSTSISAGLGMSVADDYLKKSNKNIVIIGDGALTGGMAFEALNHAGHLKKDLLVILNDNQMSIDPNVGALKEYLVKIGSSHTYTKMKNEIWNLLGKLSKVGKIAQDLSHKLEAGFKTTFMEQGNLFEALNFEYYGTVDGHDLPNLIKTLDSIKDISGPKLLHCLTKKGKGYKMSEFGNETFWHSPSTFDKITGNIIKIEDQKVEPKKYQDVFGETILELSKTNDKIIGVTPAMPTGGSLNIMMKENPERVFDVGICEQHAVTFSAGLATQGLLPFCNIYSTFLQRGYDQLIHDVAIQNLKVIFCIDRAGLVGNDGVTHQGLYDISFLRCIPNLIISAPLNEHELRNLMYTAQLDKIKNPFTIRYPRGKGEFIEWKNEMKEIEIGKGVLIKEGNDIAVLSIGTIGNNVIKALKLIEDNLSVAHYDMRFIKPIDEELLYKVFKKFKKIITIEDGALAGGFGSLVLEYASDVNANVKIKRLGVSDVLIEHSSQQEQYEQCGISVNKIAEFIKKY